MLTRIFAPYLMRYMSKKMQERFGDQFQQSQNTSNSMQKEGETVIDKVPQSDKSSNKNVGEYVDYEEID